MVCNYADRLQEKHLIAIVSLLHYFLLRGHSNFFLHLLLFILDSYYRVSNLKTKAWQISTNSNRITEIQSSFFLKACVGITYKRIFSIRVSSSKIFVSILFMILHYPTDFSWIKIIFYTCITLISSEVIRNLSVPFYSNWWHFLSSALF